MNEQAIFLAALDISDRAERAAYVEKACAGDVQLASQVNALLAAHERSGEFLDVPACEQIAPLAVLPIDSTLNLDAEEKEPPMAKQNPLDTQAEPNDDANNDGALNFLEPSTKPGSLGRLAHYEVLEILGQGGFGTVVRAFDEKLQRVVAIKIMSPQMAATSPPRKRFLREARASAKIRHENVVAIYDTQEQPIPYLVMEYIPGETLQHKLDRVGPFDVMETLRIGQQIALGLAAAHAEGLVHRDIKPANILLESGVGQKVKITDFGLARAADDASLTQSGMIAGTPMFMAPEQAAGVTLDHRADLFSFGSVLYVMCSGRPPFRASTTLAVMKRVAEDTPRPIREIIPEVPQWLCDLVTKLHAKNPDDRFQSAREVADVFGRYLAELQAHGIVQHQPAAQATGSPDKAPTLARPAGSAAETTLLPAPPTRSKNHWVALAAAALLILGIGIGLSESLGVTNLGGTVIRLFSSEGTLIVEVDDPDVSVTIDGEEIVIKGAGAKEIRVKPGQYKVIASKDGKVVRQELVNVTKNGRQIVRVSREADPLAKIDPAKDKPPITVEKKPEIKEIKFDPKTTAGSFALEFDGKSKVVIESLKLPRDTPLTIEAYFSAAKNPPKRAMCILGVREQFCFWVKDEAEMSCILNLERGSGSGPVILNAFSDRKTHVASVFWTDGKLESKLHSWVNGKSCGTYRGEGGILRNSTNLFTLGEELVGRIHTVRISKTARYETGSLGKTPPKFTPAERFVPDADTLALYHFDEGTGDVLNDSSGNGHHGKIVGAKWVAMNSTPSPLISASDRALSFDGGGTVDVPTLKVPSSSGFTMEGYVTWESKNPEEFVKLIGNMGFQLALYAHRSQKSCVLQFLKSKDEHNTISAVISRLGAERFHVAAVRSDKETRLYINGKKMAAYGSFPPKQTEDSLFRLGVHHIGTLDEVRISNTARYDKDFTPPKRYELDADTLALYHFDEGTGDVLKDSSGNGHHGKIVGAKWVNADGTPIVEPTAPNQFALRLLPQKSKSNEGLNFPASLDVDVDKPVTIEAYIVPDEVREGGIFGVQRFGVKINKDHQWTIQNDSRSNPAGPFVLPGNRAAVSGKRNHVAAVRTAEGDALLFVDGKLVVKLPKSAAITPTNNEFTFRNFYGRVSEIRISKSARYVNDFTPQQRFEKDPDTLALYHCDEGTGDVLKDSSGHGHHGKIVGAKWVNADGTPIAPPPALFDYALELDGKGKAAELPVSLVVSKPFTIEAYLISKGGKGTAIYAPGFIGLDAGSTWGFMMRDSKNKGNVLISHEAVRNQRTHVAGVYTGKDMMLFVDGKLVQSKSLPSSPLLKADVKLGMGFANFQGVLDEVRISQVARYKEDFTPQKRFAPDVDTLALYHCDEGTGNVLKDSSGNDHHGKILSATWVTTAPPIDEAWVKAVAAMPADQQLTQVIDKLKELNPGFDGKIKLHKSDGPVVTEFQSLMDTGPTSFASTVKDISPLRALTGLKKLTIHGTWASGKLTDIAPLKDLKLTYLDIAGHQKLTDLSALKDMPLTELRCQTTQATDLAPLKGMQLTVLVCGEKKLSDLSALKGMPLQILDINKTIVSDLTPLRFMPLTDLDCRATDVSDTAIDHLRTLTKLKRLDLQYTKMTSQGVETLRKALPKCTILWNEDPDRLAAEWVISIGGGVGFDGGPYDIYNVSNLPKPFRPVDYFYLNGNKKVTDESLAIFKDCPKLAGLFLDGTSISDAGLAHFKDHKNLRDLNIQGTKVTDAGLALFEECKNLRTLALGKTAVTDAGLEHFRFNKFLKNLKLNDAQISDAGLAHFQDSKLLTHVQLENTKITDQSLEFLSGFAKLSHLHIKKTNATEAAVKKLAAALPSCRIEWDGGVIEPRITAADPDLRAAQYLIFNGGLVGSDRIYDIGTIGEVPEKFRLFYFVLKNRPNVTDEGFAHLKDCKLLRGVYMEGVPVGDAGMYRLKDCKEMDNLHLIGSKVTDAGLVHCKGYVKLKSLSLAKTQVTDAGMMHVKDCKTLEDLNLEQTAVSDKSVEALSGFVKLTKLNLKKTKFTEAGVKKLAAALPQCKIEWDGGVIEPTK